LTQVDAAQEAAGWFDSVGPSAILGFVLIMGALIAWRMLAMISKRYDAELEKKDATIVGLATELRECSQGRLADRDSELVNRDETVGRFERHLLAGTQALDAVQTHVQPLTLEGIRAVVREAVHGR